MKEQRKSKIYVVDGNIDLRFAVTGDNEVEAKHNAEKLIKKVMDTELLGSFGWNLKIKEIREAKTIERKA